MRNLFDLTGRVALITGGNSGIGFGIASGLAKAGATLMIAGRDIAKNQAAAATLKASGTNTESVVVDVTDPLSIIEMVKQTTNHFGRLDILVNNAGINIRHRPENYKLEDWHTVINTNLTSVMLASQAAYPYLKLNGFGRVINIGSMLSIFGLPLYVAYGASKGGILQMTKSIAAAWAQDGITVNAILPGWIDTELTRKARQEIEGLNESVLARTPAKRWGMPTDFEGIAAFLASDAAAFVTGAAIPVDGGYSVQG